MAVAALAAAAIAAHAEPVSYGLMPEQTWVEAEVLHFGTSTIRARFGPIAGEVVLDREKRSGEVSITIDTNGRVCAGLVRIAQPCFPGRDTGRNPRRVHAARHQPAAHAEGAAFRLP
jgi:hypothetical protein